MTDIQNLSQQLNSKQISVRYNAAITLAKLGRKEGIPTLINAVEQRHWEHCNLYEVVDLLAELQEPKAVDALIELLDVSGHIVGNALSALLVIDDKRGVDAVFKMMGHSSPWFAWGTAQLIASYEGRYLERLLALVKRLSEN